MICIKNLRLVWFYVILPVKIEQSLFYLLIDIFLFYYVIMRIDVCDEQMCCLTRNIIEIETIYVMKRIVVVLNQVDDIDKPIRNPPIETS